MHHHAHIGFRDLPRDRAEKSDGHNERLAQQAEQPERVAVEERHHALVIHLPPLRAMGLSVGGTVTRDVAPFKGQCRGGAAAEQVAAGDEDDKLLRRRYGRLI